MEKGCPAFSVRSSCHLVALRLDTYSVVSKALGRNSLVKAGLASCCTADNSAAMSPFFDCHLHFKQSCCIFIAGVWVIFWLQRCTVLVCSTSLSIRDTLHVVLFSTPLQDPCTSGCQRRSPNAQRRLLRWMGKSLKFRHVHCVRPYHKVETVEFWFPCPWDSNSKPRFCPSRPQHSAERCFGEGRKIFGKPSACLTRTWGWFETHYHHIWENNNPLTSYFMVPRVPAFWPIATSLAERRVSWTQFNAGTCLCTRDGILSEPVLHVFSFFYRPDHLNLAMTRLVFQ